MKHTRAGALRRFAPRVRWHERCSIDAMTRQWKGAALALAFVAAFMVSIAFHSVVAAVVVLLSAVTISYVVGIAWMRTSTHRMRPKHHHQIPR